MYSRILVPSAGGEFSARALPVARAIARASDAPVHLMSFALTASYSRDLEASIEDTARSVTDVPITTTVARVDNVVKALVDEVLEQPGTLVCMASVGRAHTEPILGSYAESILREVFGPVVLVGPHAQVDDYSLAGTMVVTTDGSDTAKAILPIASQWAIAYHLDPWLVTVSPPTGGGADADVPTDINIVAHEAKAMQRDIGRTVQYDALHSNHPATALVEFAASRQAALVAMATHGTTGLRRAALGSVSMAVVHRASCPVLVQRPPHLPKGA